MKRTILTNNKLKILVLFISFSVLDANPLDKTDHHNRNCEFDLINLNPVEVISKSNIPGKTLKKINNSIRPITFSCLNEYNSCFDYNFNGTGFFVKIYGIELFLTARHNFGVENRVSNYESYHERARDFFLIRHIKTGIDLKYKSSRIPIESIYSHTHLNDPEIFSSDIYDIATVTLEEKLKFDVLEIPTILDNRAVEGDYIVISGYPTTNNTRVNYDEDNESSTMQLKKEYLLGKVLKDNHGITEVDMLPNSNIIDYNGLSGSPVFKIVKRGRRTDLVLTGMVIRGAASSNKIHFIPLHSIALFVLDKLFSTYKYFGKPNAY